MMLSKKYKAIVFSSFSAPALKGETAEKSAHPLGSGQWLIINNIFFGQFFAYFAGAYFSVSTKKSQNFPTDTIFTFSSGE